MKLIDRGNVCSAMLKGIRAGEKRVRFVERRLKKKVTLKELKSKAGHVELKCSENFMF